MRKRIQKAIFSAVTYIAASAPALAAGGGRLAATQAVSGLASEFSGPLAYGRSLVAIVGTAVSWYRYHHDWTERIYLNMELSSEAALAVSVKRFTLPVLEWRAHLVLSRGLARREIRQWRC